MVLQLLLDREHSIITHSNTASSTCGFARLDGNFKRNRHKILQCKDVKDVHFQSPQEGGNTLHFSL